MMPGWLIWSAVTVGWVCLIMGAAFGAVVWVVR